MNNVHIHTYTYILFIGLNWTDSFVWALMMMMMMMLMMMMVMMMVMIMMMILGTKYVNWLLNLSVASLSTKLVSRSGRLSFTATSRRDSLRCICGRGFFGFSWVAKNCIQFYWVPHFCQDISPRFQKRFSYVFTILLFFFNVDSKSIKKGNPFSWTQPLNRFMSSNDKGHDSADDPPPSERTAAAWEGPQPRPGSNHGWSEDTL